MILAVQRLCARRRKNTSKLRHRRVAERVDVPLVVMELLVLFFMLFVMLGSRDLASESARI